MPQDFSRQVAVRVTELDVQDLDAALESAKEQSPLLKRAQVIRAALRIGVQAILSRPGLAEAVEADASAAKGLTKKASGGRAR